MASEEDVKKLQEELTAANTQITELKQSLESELAKRDTDLQAKLQAFEDQLNQTSANITKLQEEKAAAEANCTELAASLKKAQEDIQILNGHKENSDLRINDLKANLAS